MAALPDQMPEQMPTADPGPMSPMIRPNPQQVLDGLLNAVEQAARAGAAASDTRESSECAKAALAYAQAWAILNPQLDPAGLPLDHHIQLAQTQAQGQIALEQVRGANALAVAKESARAPTPQRSVTVRRDNSGRISGATASG